MSKIKKLLLFALPVFLLASCDKEDIDGGQDIPAGHGGDIEFAIGFAPQTRASTAADFTSTWEDGDEIGVFAVAHGGTLAASGNHIHNVKLTYRSAGSGSWSADSGSELWWPTTGSGITALDFYAYHPYDVGATDPTAIAFNVSADQNGDTGGKSNYNLSDLLTAKSTNGTNGWAKTDGAVSLTFSHALAMVEVTVDDRVGALDINKGITVKLRGVKVGAALDLSAADGTTPGSGVTQPTTDNDAADIMMYRVPDADGYVYRALVPAQTLDDGKSIFRIISGDVLLNGAKLTGELVMIGGRAETFTQKTPYTSLPFILAKDKTFSMGETGYATPVHDVTFTKDFYMSRYQITNAQYAAFLNANSIGSNGKGDVTYYKTDFITPVMENQTFLTTNSWGLKWETDKWMVSTTGYNSYPIINVTWYGAKAYADWVGGTLPTEAQWEYACRGGTTTSFYFGDNANDMGASGWSYENNTSGGYPLGTKPVGLKNPNAYGLYDMHGNVLEWCSDWYGPYSSTGVTDPVGLEYASSRVLRGGYWYRSARYCRSAYRYSYNPDIANYGVGFRVAFVP